MKLVFKKRNSQYVFCVCLYTCLYMCKCVCKYINVCIYEGQSDPLLGFTESPGILINFFPTRRLRNQGRRVTKEVLGHKLSSLYTF